MFRYILARMLLPCPSSWVGEKTIRGMVTMNAIMPIRNAAAMPEPEIVNAFCISDASPGIHNLVSRTVKVNQSANLTRDMGDFSDVFSVLFARFWRSNVRAWDNQMLDLNVAESLNFLRKICKPISLGGSASYPPPPMHTLRCPRLHLTRSRGCP